MTNYVFAETAWERARLGKFTASEIDKLFTLPRSKKALAAGEIAKTAKAYIESRAAEIVTGCYRQLILWAMEWGTMTEPEAAGRLADFFPNMEYFGKNNPQFFKLTDFSGGSPDCIDLTEGLVSEIKCPAMPENHLRYCLLNTGEDLLRLHRRHYYQVQMNMACAAMKYAIPFKELRGIFCSYHPLIKTPYPDFFILEVKPDLTTYHNIMEKIRWAEGLLAELLWTYSHYEYKMPIAA
jgi:hypothetical protein